MNIQDRFPLGLTGLISLLSKGLSRVFSNTKIQKHKFFSTQPSLWSNSHISYMTTGKTIALTRWTFVGKVMSLLFHTLSRFVREKKNFSSKEETSFNFKAAVTIHSDFGAQGNKVCHCFHFRGIWFNSPPPISSHFLIPGLKSSISLGPQENYHKPHPSCQQSSTRVYMQHYGSSLDFWKPWKLWDANSEGSRCEEME